MAHAQKQGLGRRLHFSAVPVFGRRSSQALDTASPLPTVKARRASYLPHRALTAATRRLLAISAPVSLCTTPGALTSLSNSKLTDDEI
ncbi:MAG: hypothetical protein GW822_05695 [Sphingomonadales bacterium]|nr:hypothetical protein [Sphingomonadales bacterium]